MTTAVFGFGNFGAAIKLPGFSPYCLTYVPSEQYLIACQFENGQAVRYVVTSTSQVGPLQTMFSPVSEGRAAGIAWHEEEEVLYWLNMLGQEGSGSETYRLLRSTIDGFALEAGPVLEIEPGRVLGDIAYVPELGAILTVDAERDIYLSFDPETGEQLDLTFPAPLRHPDTGFAYGLGLDYVPAGEGQLDILTGLLVDLRAMRVVRVDLDGSPFGVSYLLDVPSDDVRPEWPVGIAYCRGNEGHFSAIADRFGDQILLFNTRVPAAPGLTNVTTSVQYTEIGPGQDTEAITVAFSWQNNGAYDTVLLEYLDPILGEFMRATQVGQGETQASHDINREGAFTYRLTPFIGAADLPATWIDVSTGGGRQLAKGTTQSGTMPTSPFAIAMSETDELILYVAEIRARQGEQGAAFHRFRRGGPGELVRIDTITSPLPLNVLAVGLAWNSTTNQLVWLGNLLDGLGIPLNKYVLARTSPEGDLIGQVVPVAVNPFPRSTLGDIAYDPVADTFWVLSRENQTIWAVNAETGMPTGERVRFPASLPGESGTWGLSKGIAVVPGRKEGTSLFFAALGKIPTVSGAPALGAGFVSRLVPFVRQGESSALVVGQPVDLPIATGSAEIGGVAVTGGSEPTAFVVAQDVGQVYEVSLRGSGPLFSRGDANGDSAVDVADAIFVLEYLFAGGAEPACLDTADANDTGMVNLADPLYVLRHVFGLLSEGVRPSPFGLCGTDPTADGLPCLSYPPCE